MNTHNDTPTHADEARDASPFHQNLTKRQRTGLRHGLVIGGLLVLAAAAFAATRLPGSGAHEQPSPDRATPVTTTPLALETGFTIETQYTGIVQARRTSELGFRVAGILEHVAVEDGASVKTGDILASLDTRPLEARKRELEAQRAGAAARLDELVAGPRTEVIAAAEARVRQAEAKLARLNLTLERIRRVSESDAASEAELDDATFERDEAAAALDEARDRLQELENGTRVEQVTAQRAEVARLDSLVQQIDVDLFDSHLRAPFDGRVDRRQVDEGRVIAPATTVLRIFETAHLEVWVGVPTTMLDTLTVGSAHRFTSAGGDVSGTVADVMPSVDDTTRTIRVRFDLDATPTARIGDVVRLHVSEQVASNGAWLPTSALTEGRRGLWGVFVIDASASSDPIVRRAEVELLHTSGDRAFVRSALPAGTRVITNGVHRLAPGQIVREESSQ